MRTGGEGDVGAGEEGGDLTPLGEMAQEGHGQSAGQMLQRGSHRPVARDHQVRRRSRPMESAERGDAAVGALLHREASAVGDERTGAVGPPCAQVRVEVSWVEDIEVDAERGADDVGRPHSIELRGGEVGGAHDGVVVTGGGRVRAVGQCTCGAAGHDLAEQPVEAFMGHHRRMDVSPASPPAEAAQGEAVGHLEGVGTEMGEDVGDAAGRRQAVAARGGNPRCGHGDPRDPRVQRLLAGIGAGNDQDDVVTGPGIPGAPAVHRGAQTAGAAAVEVRELDDPHGVQSARPG